MKNNYKKNKRCEKTKTAKIKNSKKMDKKKIIKKKKKSQKEKYVSHKRTRSNFWNNVNKFWFKSINVSIGWVF